MNLWSLLRRCCSPIQQRFVVATLVMTGLALQYIHRLAFNLTITVITHKLNTTKEYSSELCEYNKTSEGKGAEKESSQAEFYWNGQDQALALGAFYIGYILSHVPGGVLSDKYGPKRVLGYGVLLTTVCTILTPTTARVNIYMVSVMRIVMGVAQGPVFPALATFNARWCLPNERGFFSAYMSAGVVLGAITSNALTGYLLSKMNWTLIFYTYGIVTGLWFILWYLFAHDTPSNHPFIGEKEKGRLVESLQSEVSGDAKKMKVPYLAILTSKPVWAMILAGCGHDWAFYIVVSLMPQYMSYVLHFSIVENGLINCLPYIAMIMVSLSTAKLAELIIAKGWMSKTVQCKLWLLICNMMPCVFFIAASYVGCNRLWAVVFFMLSMGIMGMTYSCIRVVHVDMSPNFAGLLMALMNGFGSICGILGPPVFALFTKEEQSVGKWREAFYFSTVLVTICTVIFLIWGTSLVQPWNSPATPPENVDGTEATSSTKPATASTKPATGSTKPENEDKQEKQA